MKKQRKTIIHVNQHKIRSNNKLSFDVPAEPILTVKNGTDNKYCHEVELHGRFRIKYSRKKPLHCGAKCWIESVELYEPVHTIVNTDA